MSVVIIGGNECMSRQYADVCMEHGCTAKVFPKETGPIEKKIGSPDLMILFTRTVSHKMVQGAVKAAKKNSIPGAEQQHFCTAGTAGTERYGTGIMLSLKRWA